MNEMATPASKAALRRSLLKTRQALPVEHWRQYSVQLCTHLAASPFFTQARTILAYFSVRQEPDLSPLFDTPKTWGFPRCVGKSLRWHVWSPTAELPLQSNAYGIPEPHPDAPELTAEEVDLILVPAVACDHRGYRLGYGGGFYDRLLSNSAWAAKPTIGIIFNVMKVTQIPTDPWDQPLSAVCTEAGFLLAQN